MHHPAAAGQNAGSHLTPDDNFPLIMKTNNKLSIPSDFFKRVVIKNITPLVASGKYAAKAILGIPVTLSANILADGHDHIFARALVKAAGDKQWTEYPMSLLVNDHWEVQFTPPDTGNYEFKIQAWISHLDSWKDGYEKKQKASADVQLELRKGLELLDQLMAYAAKAEQKDIKHLRQAHEEKGLAPEDIPALLYQKLLRLTDKAAISSTDVLGIDVERKKAGFSTWYELFPRSCAPAPGMHGTFTDVVQQLPEIAAAGFDVLYLPPVHPIGHEKRKGRNNSLEAGPVDPGSPWAIGSIEGGHKHTHPELGTIEEFKQLVKEARKLDIEIAMDIAFQCAPDHPYVKEHPEWFKWRADGTVQFAENPPKKYEDILPFDFESKDWHALWEELLSIFTFWIDKGVKIFRVDNPHTKSLRLWEWLIGEVRAKHPEVIFLAEAFTRPHIMEHLAMTGFTQSYTYFTWRNTKSELEAYMTELTQGDKQFFFRPNFWPNTPDILPEHLVTGGENAHIIRVLLAATLSANYGLYGPVYQRGINEPMKGKEEYADNEKYEIKYWEPQPPTRIWNAIKKVNQLRHQFAALQTTNNIEFLPTSNESVMAYLKKDVLHHHHLLIVITLDSHTTQSAWVNIPRQRLEEIYGGPLRVYDHLNDEQYDWDKDWNYVELNPAQKPAHLFSMSAF